MKIYSLKAILLGWLAGLVFFILLFLILLNLYDLAIQFVVIPRHSYILVYSTFTFSAVLIAFITGGFITGKIAKQKQPIHGLLSGFLFSITFGGLMFLTSKQNLLDSTRIAATLLILLSPLVLFTLGAYIAKKRREKSEISTLKKLQNQKIEEFGKIQED